MIILIHGQKRSGKDFIADIFVKKAGFEKRAFANKMKEIIATTFDIPRETLEDYKNEEKQLFIKNKKDEYEEIINFRKILQRFGTEATKKIFGNNIWAELTVKDYNKNKNIVISDLRFLEDELLYVKNKFPEDVISIKITDNSIKRNDQHISEKPIDDKYFDFIFDNSKKDFLEAENFVEKLFKEIINKKKSER